MNQEDLDFIAHKANWFLYLEYGLGKYPNWLTMSHDKLPRSKLVEAARNEKMRQKMINRIKKTEDQIAEVKDFLDEGDACPLRYRIMPEALMYMENPL